MEEHVVQYDPMDTVRWMIESARDELTQDTVTGPNGRPKKKTKAQIAAEQIRFATLCEVLWNVEGRPGELTHYADTRMAA